MKKSNKRNQGASILRTSHAPSTKRLARARVFVGRFVFKERWCFERRLENRCL